MKLNVRICLVTGCVVGICVLAAALFLSEYIEAHRTLKHLRKNTSFARLALALRNYHDIHGEFPPTSGTNFSWRLVLWNSLDDASLHEPCPLERPWNSQKNLQWSDHIGGCPILFKIDNGKTSEANFFLVSDIAGWRPERASLVLALNEGPDTVLLGFAEDGTGHWLDPEN